jgi:hypothetical protein
MPSADAATWCILKLVSWALLFIAAAAHAVARARARALARARVRSRGWQLNRAIVALLCAQTVVAALDVAATFRSNRGSVLAAFAAVYDLADAAFLALLMARARAAAIRPRCSC